MRLVPRLSVGGLGCLAQASVTRFARCAATGPARARNFPCALGGPVLNALRPLMTASAAAATPALHAHTLEREWVVFHGPVIHSLELSDLEVLEDAYLGGVSR